MLGTGLIGLFYTQTLHGQRNRDRVHVVYSRSEERAQAFCAENGVPEWTTDLEEAIAHPETDTVVIGLPNHLHEEAVELCARARQGRPLHEAARADRGGGEADARHRRARRRLRRLPRGSRLHAEDAEGGRARCRPARSATCSGRARARRTPARTARGSGTRRRRAAAPIVDLGCHCIEIIRSYMGKENRPVEVMCWTDTLVHPIEAEDNAIALIRFESGAIGQFEVSWTFRGGMDLRDEVAGTEGTIWPNHFLRTGFEVFTRAAAAATWPRRPRRASGWLFPVGDEVAELGYVDMFTDMFDAIDEGRAPRETFYDGYVVNAIIDACYRSAETRHWEPVQLEDWRGAGVPRIARDAARARRQDGDQGGEDARRPLKLILKDEATGEFVDVVS